MFPLHSDMRLVTPEVTSYFMNRFQMHFKRWGDYILLEFLDYKT
jgi:hypothetical protein